MGGKTEKNFDWFWGGVRLVKKDQEQNWRALRSEPSEPTWNVPCTQLYIYIYMFSVSCLWKIRAIIGVPKVVRTISQTVAGTRRSIDRRRTDGIPKIPVYTRSCHKPPFRGEWGSGDGVGGERPVRAEFTKRQNGQKTLTASREPYGTSDQR